MAGDARRAGITATTRWQSPETTARGFNYYVETERDCGWLTKKRVAWPASQIEGVSRLPAMLLPFANGTHTSCSFLPCTVPVHSDNTGLRNTYLQLHVITTHPHPPPRSALAGWELGGRLPGHLGAFSPALLAKEYFQCPPEVSVFCKTHCLLCVGLSFCHLFHVAGNSFDP